MQLKISDDMSTTAVPQRGRDERAPRSVPALTVISHPQPQRIGERLLLEALATPGRTVSLSRNAPDFSRPGSMLALPLGDAFLSRKPVHFESLGGGASRLVVPEDGTQVRVCGEPLLGGREFSPEELAAGVPLVLAERVVLLLHMGLFGGARPGRRWAWWGRARASAACARRSPAWPT